MSRRAWTGGSPPRPLASISLAELFDVGLLYAEQCQVYREAWGDVPEDVARIFWGRARHDAHATHRPGLPGWEG